MIYAFTNKAQNLILNGSFELNSETQCYNAMYSNTWNTTVAFSTAYGSRSEILKDSCEKCIPPTFWGGGAKEGAWFTILASKPFTNPTVSGWSQSRFSFDLDHPLDSNKNYKLSFYIKEPPPEPIIHPACGDPLNNSIHIGISNYSNSFGAHIYSSPLGDSIWKQYSVVFNPQNSEEYITVEVDTGNVSQYGIFVDNFVLVETTEPLTTEINEAPQQKKQLLKIVDILGRESKSKKGLLFYIYSDGTVEKKIIIE